MFLQISHTLFLAAIWLTCNAVGTYDTLKNFESNSNLANMGKPKNIVSHSHVTQSWANQQTMFLVAMLPKVGQTRNYCLHSQKRTSCSKSPISKPISGCVCIAYSGLMITSLLQDVNRLAASCELHAGLM